MSMDVNSVNTTKNWSLSSQPTMRAATIIENQPTDSFEKTEKTEKTSKQKTWIGIGLGSIILVAIGLVISKKLKLKKLPVETNGKTPTVDIEPKVKPQAEPKVEPNIEAPKLKEAPVIKYEKGEDPRAIIGCDEQTAKELLAKFQKYKEKKVNFKPYLEMTSQEQDEFHRWHREDFHPLKDKIKEHNISVIEKKEFSSNPNEQVNEKHEYVQKVLGMINYNEASYYDGLEIFEKYGKREEFANMGISTLSRISIDMPKIPTEKTVNKFMDIFEKHGIYDYTHELTTDGMAYMNVLEMKGVLKTEDQIRKALDKGKKILWNHDQIGELRYTLMGASDALFKNNKNVEKLIEEFYQTAFNNRTPYKDDIGMQGYEKIRGIKRD